MGVNENLPAKTTSGYEMLSTPQYSHFIDLETFMRVTTIYWTILQNARICFMTAFILDFRSFASELRGYNHGVLINYFPPNAKDVFIKFVRI